MVSVTVYLNTRTSAEKESLHFMENLAGLLRVHVSQGIDLAIRDISSSDPYVVIKMGKQKLKTRVVKQSVNPKWNEDLTLAVADPNLPIKLTVYDKDMLLDDKMGEAVIDIGPFLEAVRMRLENLPDGTIIRKVIPNRQNYLVEESHIMLKDNKVVQDICVRLKKVECGEVELQLQWIDLPGSKGL
ncbi:hypothetical protein GIB67_002531 [Kingdonia uniflora]|uniref:C2 domain-containing protein n=1 Tax=Kingdonia uniflora TaxID=39325 RepID=A0A7J7N8R6_9MAGN|nr:hypothetical protein GIB67_002531 [Kingdonia uniflora]